MEQVMQCNAMMKQYLSWYRGGHDSRQRHGRYFCGRSITAVSQARLHSNLPWPMVRAPSTKDGQAQSRALANVLWRALRGPRVC
jgi:hypothetical protein